MLPSACGRAGARVLVLGCGTSSLPLDLAADGFAVTATDIAPAAVERMRARATALVGPVLTLSTGYRALWHARTQSTDD